MTRWHRHNGMTRWHDQMSWSVWHDDMTEWHGKRWNDVGGGIYEGGGGVKGLTFLGRGEAREGGQHSTPKFLICFFCDISLLIE